MLGLPNDHRAFTYTRPIGLYDTRLEIHLSNDPKSRSSYGDSVSDSSQHGDEPVPDSHDGLHAVLLTRLSCASPRAPPPLSSSCPQPSSSPASTPGASTPYTSTSLTRSCSRLPHQHSANCCFSIPSADTYADLTIADHIDADYTAADLRTADPLASSQPPLHNHPHHHHRHHHHHHTMSLPRTSTRPGSSPCPQMADSATCPSGVRMELQVLP